MWNVTRRYKLAEVGLGIFMPGYVAESHFTCFLITVMGRLDFKLGGAHDMRWHKSLQNYGFLSA